MTPTQNNSKAYPPPPTTVPVADLGAYLRQRRLAIVTVHHVRSQELIVLVQSDISTDIPKEATPNATL